MCVVAELINFLGLSIPVREKEGGRDGQENFSHYIGFEVLRAVTTKMFHFLAYEVVQPGKGIYRLHIQGGRVRQTRNYK
jgi:hypothetical protein